MAKKQKIILAAAVLLLAVGAIFLLKQKPTTGPLAPASKTNKTSQAEKQRQLVDEFLNSSDPDLRAIATATSPKEAPEPTAVSKIEAQFQAGKIDVNKYLKLKVLAIFAPDKLPAEWQSQTSARLEGDRILAEIIDYNDQLDAATKNLLAPFLLPPDDPNSFFNPAADKEKIIDNLIASLK